MTVTNAPQAVLGFLASQDLRVMRRVQRWRPPRWVRWWMIAATRGGDGWLWDGQGAILLLRGGPDRFPAALAAALACGSGILLFQILKRGIGRQRPSVLARHDWVRLLPPDEFSLPSGRTIPAFGFAIA